MTMNTTNKMMEGGFLKLSHVYVDKLMALLTSNEFKLMVYAIRRIEGFHKDQDAISISQFTKGIRSDFDRDKVLSRGTGLCIETVRKCLANLVEFGLLIETAKNNPTTNHGTTWALQEDPEKIRWEILEDRLEQKAKRNRERMTKARSSRHQP